MPRHHAVLLPFQQTRGGHQHHTKMVRGRNPNWVSPVDFTNEGIHGLNHDRATLPPCPDRYRQVTWDKTLSEACRAGGWPRSEGARLYQCVHADTGCIARPALGPGCRNLWRKPFFDSRNGQANVPGRAGRRRGIHLKANFAVYSVPKGGRDGADRTDPHVAPRELYEMFLYPFRRVIQEAHPLGVMSSYNDWNGEPVTGSYFFLTELLRQKFGFNGYVVSDSEAVEFLYSKHHVADSPEEAVREAFEAGLNVRTNFTMPQTFILPLRNLYKEGKISMKTLDSRVGDVLRVKFKLGLF